MVYEHWIGYGPNEELRDRFIEESEVEAVAETCFQPDTHDVHRVGSYRVENIGGGDGLPTVLSA